MGANHIIKKRRSLKEKKVDVSKKSSFTSDSTKLNDSGTLGSLNTSSEDENKNKTAISDPSDDLDIRNELLEFQNSIVNMKDSLSKPKKSLTDLQRRNSFSNSKNTLTLIENELGIEDVECNLSDIVDEKEVSRNSIDITNKNTSLNYSFTSSDDYTLSYEYRKCDDIKKSYISKLITSHVWSPCNSLVHDGITILDWDDTLLCTTFLTPNGVYDEDLQLTKKEEQKISHLCSAIKKLLVAIIEKSDVYIITNAQPGWVEYSAERFYPDLLPILKNVKIISARGKYEKKYPGDTLTWKIRSFADVVADYNENCISNVVCIGDSFIEVEGAKFLLSRFPNAFIKSIKFREAPKPDELDKQISLVEENFCKIFYQRKNLSIVVNKKAK